MPEINFFWDPLSDNILQERDETGAVTAEYTAEPGLYGNIISQNRGGVESQFHYDAQGSTIAVTDDNQNVTDTFGYTAFGEVTERTGTTEVPFQYIGQKGYYTDSVTGQITARRRPYEAVRARWMSPDVLGLLEDPNVYRYARSNPMRFVDPSGMLIWKEAQGVTDESGNKIDAFAAGECGKYAWYINWDLNETVDRFPDGYIVQMVAFTFVVKDCCDKTVQIHGECNARPVGIDKAIYKHVYFEVWRVKDGKIYLDIKERVPSQLAEPYHDLFAWKGMDRSKGCVTEEGEAIFVTDLRGVGDLKPAGVEFAGKLFSTCSLPPGMTFDRLKTTTVKKGKTARRVIEAEWNCCPSDAEFEDKSTKVEKGEKAVLENRCKSSK